MEDVSVMVAPQGLVTDENKEDTPFIFFRTLLCTPPQNQHSHVDYERTLSNLEELL